MEEGAMPIPQGRPLLIPLASLILGATAADLFGIAPPTWPFVPLLLLTFFAAFTKGGIAFHFGIAVILSLWGASSIQEVRTAENGLRPNAGAEVLRIEGTVEGRPEPVPSGGCRLAVRVARLYRGESPVGGGGKLLLYVKAGKPLLLDGDRILFASRLHTPRLYGLPGESDYARLLANRGIQATAFVKGTDDVIRVSCGSGCSRRIDALAGRLADFIGRNVRGEEGPVLKALLLGESGAIAPEISEAYARGGVNHILSISGFHVGIIFLCVFQTLFCLGRCSETLAMRLNLRRAALFGALPVVICYLFLSGAAPATVRSVLMIAAGGGALLVSRETDAINAIMLAAFSILAVAPEKLFELSFQLSFLAIWGLVVLTTPLQNLAGKRKRWWRWPLLLAIASVAAITATAVPVAYYFHRISLIGVFSNLLVVPLMGYGAVVTGFLALAVSLVWEPAAALLIHAAAWLVSVSDAVIGWFAQVPPVTGYRPGGTDLLLSFLLLTVLTFVPRGRIRLAAAGAILGAMISLGFFGAAVNETGRMHVYFLSVGQGDSALVGLPDGATMLVDGGGSFHEGDQRVGERLLAPALWRLGVRRIDYLVLSHAHPDHLQGLLYLAANLPVGEFWESGRGAASPDYARLKWILAARGVPSRTLRRGLPTVAVGGAVLEPLWPDPGEGESEDENDSSLAFRLRYGRASVLFAGDVGADDERELVARRSRLCCSILKVPHHGSRHSSSTLFLAAAAPKAAVISAGYGNVFRLPAPDTLERYRAAGIPVYRTDLAGTIEAICSRDGSCSIAAPWGHFD